MEKNDCISIDIVRACVQDILVKFSRNISKLGAAGHFFRDSTAQQWSNWYDTRSL